MTAKCSIQGTCIVMEKKKKHVRAREKYTMCICGRAGKSECSERGGGESLKNWKQKSLINCLHRSRTDTLLFSSVFQQLRQTKYNLLLLCFQNPRCGGMRAAMNQKQEKKRGGGSFNGKWVKNQNISYPDNNPRVHLCWPNVCAFTRVNHFSHYFD